MQKVAFYSKWLDGSNGLVKDYPKNEMEQNETETLLLAMPSNSTAGLLARVVKSVVSFLQNLLFPQTQKEGVRAEKVSRLRALSQTTAIGTLYGLLFASLLLAPIYPAYSAVDNAFPCLSTEAVEIQTPSGSKHYGAVCSDQWDDFMKCAQNAAKTNRRALRDARNFYRGCNIAARSAAGACAIRCFWLVKGAPACLLVCASGLAAARAACWLNYQIRKININNAFDDALEDCLDEYTPPRISIIRLPNNYRPPMSYWDLIRWKKQTRSE